jgi:hypothetical protein
LITVVIGSPLPAENIDSKTLMTRAEQWIEAEVQRVSQR